MEQYTAALAGNPNVGKSTVFNTLTGMRQHTGNWPGKTVAVAEGAYTWQGAAFRLIDLPGTYSLRADSPGTSSAAAVPMSPYWWRTPPASGEICIWRCSCAAARRGW